MPKRSSSLTDNYEPSSDECLNDFWNRHEGNEPWPEKPTGILLKFRDRLNWMYEPGKDHGLDPGEIVLMINHNFGYWFGEVPWGRMDEIREWLKNNWFRSFQIKAKHYHHELMETENPYSEWFKRMEKTTDYSKEYHQEVRQEW